MHIPLEKKLQERFGFSSFRPGQKESILSLLEGRDSFALLPTGAGKSLIYQFVATEKEEGVTIVISPLIALMKDQADSLKGLGIPAESCNSTQDELTQMKVLSGAVQGKIRVLFISPERAMSSSFLNVFIRMKVNFLIVDEAHCVSQWGHDFRPEYRLLSRLRDEYPGKKFPIGAFTATATPRVRDDIVKSLGMQEVSFSQGSFFRSNLEFCIEYPEKSSDKERILLRYLQNWKDSKNSNPGRVIIYCATRSQTDELYQFLNSEKFNVAKYHAGRTDGIRDRVQTAYATGKVKILIATNAFGMGIDHPDVRMVIHYQVPASLESYYQEAGRAGRDGKASRCVLFFHNADLNVQRFILSKERNTKSGGSLLGYIQEYGKTTECRQKFIAQYFGEALGDCGICDNCRTFYENSDSSSPPKKQGDRDRYIQKEEEKAERKKQLGSYELNEEEKATIHQTVENLNGKYGKTSLSAMLRGSKSKDVLRKKLDREENYGKLSHIPELSLIRYFEEGLEKKVFSTKGNKYPKICLPYLKGTTGRNSGAKQLAKNNPDETSPKPKQKTVTTNTLILRQLKSYRDLQAKKLKWKKFMVLHNAVLKRIAEEMPQTEADLYLIKGLGEAKIDKFGSDILRILSKFQ